jgi:molybdenum cofactor cytidylyltransferase
VSAAGVLLAAGAGTRFGGAVKQLAPVGGRPMLQWALDAADASSLEEIVLVLGSRADEVRAAIDPGRARLAVCEGWAAGLAASLRCGLAQVGAADWVVVLLGDAPLLRAAAVDAVLAAARGAGDEVDAVRLRVAGRPAHPVALRRRLLGGVARLRGDMGARELLRGARLQEVDGDPFGDPGDVDTAQALAQLRRRLPPAPERQTS